MSLGFLFVFSFSFYFYEGFFGEVGGFEGYSFF